MGVVQELRDRRRARRWQRWTEVIALVVGLVVAR
jgi:hypothetical protein